MCGTSFSAQALMLLYRGRDSMSKVGGLSDHEVGGGGC